MGGGSGVTSDELTAKASDVLKGKLYMGADTDDEAGTGTIPTYAGRTITPGTANQTIAAGQYLGGNVIIAGDADLKAANIKSGVNIFGVAGSCKELKYIAKYVTSSTSRKAFQQGGRETKDNYYYVDVTHNFSSIILAAASASYTDNSDSCVYHPSWDGITQFNSKYYGLPSVYPNIVLPCKYSNRSYWVTIVGY